MDDALQTLLSPSLWVPGSILEAGKTRGCSNWNNFVIDLSEDFSKSSLRKWALSDPTPTSAPSPEKFPVSRAYPHRGSRLASRLPCHVSLSRSIPNAYPIRGGRSKPDEPAGALRFLSERTETVLDSAIARGAQLIDAKHLRIDCHWAQSSCRRNGLSPWMNKSPKRSSPPDSRARKRFTETPSASESFSSVPRLGVISPLSMRDSHERETRERAWS
jgi:hypothetical protein